MKADQTMSAKSSSIHLNTSKDKTAITPIEMQDIPITCQSKTVPNKDDLNPDRMPVIGLIAKTSRQFSDSRFDG